MKQYNEKRAKRVAVEFSVNIKCERFFTLPFEIEIFYMFILQKAREKASTQPQGGLDALYQGSQGGSNFELAVNPPNWSSWVANMQ